MLDFVTSPATPNQQLPNFTIRDSEQAGYSERAADPGWVHCSGGRLYTHVHQYARC
jgi:hypothetical protein